MYRIQKSYPSTSIISSVLHVLADISALTTNTVALSLGRMRGIQPDWACSLQLNSEAEDRYPYSSFQGHLLLVWTRTKEYENQMCPEKT